jgi:predicted RNA-binding protein with PIN domain
MSESGTVTKTPSRATVPPVPEQLLVPLLDTAGDVLRRMEPHERPAQLRRLAEFDPRGLRTEAARQQLARALEVDDAFHERVAERFRERPEVAAALDEWQADAAVRLVNAAAERADLPLLASALYAARPAGWAFGLGAATAIVERQRAEKQDDDERQARVAEIASLEQMRRRLEHERDTARAEVERLARDLREERRGRRARESDAERAAAETQRRLEELEQATARTHSAREAVEARVRREVDRAREVEQELRAARRALAESEQARAELAEQLERASAPGTGLRYSDLDALTEAAELAQRLATGLGGVAEHARRVRAQTAPVGEGAPAPKADAAAKPKRAPALRPRPPVPPGMVADSPEALDAMLRAPGTVLIVDGYNVSMRAWDDATLVDQRKRLGAALASLHARTRASITLVFDGAEVEGVRGPRRPGVRVVFSEQGEEADRVIVRSVRALPARVPVVVASSDGEVRADAERHGAVVVSAPTLLGALRA